MWEKESDNAIAKKGESLTLVPSLPKAFGKRQAKHSSILEHL